MKTVRLPILDKEDVKERLAHLGADESEGLKADQLANLYSEWLEKMPADVDLFGVYVGGNQMTARRGLVCGGPGLTDSRRGRDNSPPHRSF